MDFNVCNFAILKLHKKFITIIKKGKILWASKFIVEKVVVSE